VPVCGCSCCCWSTTNDNGRRRLPTRRALIRVLHTAKFRSWPAADSAMQACLGTKGGAKTFFYSAKTMHLLAH
jgi:hypothetical protein